jgi:hypothetical protein
MRAFPGKVSAAGQPAVADAFVPVVDRRPGARALLAVLPPRLPRASGQGMKQSAHEATCRGGGGGHMPGRSSGGEMHGPGGLTAPALHPCLPAGRLDLLHSHAR